MAYSLAERNLAKSMREKRAKTAKGTKRSSDKSLAKKTLTPDASSTLPSIRTKLDVDPPKLSKKTKVSQVAPSKPEVRQVSKQADNMAYTTPYLKHAALPKVENPVLSFKCKGGASEDVGSSLKTRGEVNLGDIRFSSVDFFNDGGEVIQEKLKSMKKGYVSYAEIKYSDLKDEELSSLKKVLSEKFSEYASNPSNKIGGDVLCSLPEEGRLVLRYDGSISIKGAKVKFKKIGKEPAISNKSSEQMAKQGPSGRDHKAIPVNKEKKVEDSSPFLLSESKKEELASYLYAADFTNWEGIDTDSLGLKKDSSFFVEEKKDRPSIFDFKEGGLYSSSPKKSKTEEDVKVAFSKLAASKAKK